MTYQGILIKWNDERGFGFIKSEALAKEVFVHISTFARDGKRPTVNETLWFEVQTDTNGKEKAINVRRSATAKTSSYSRPVTRKKPNSFSKLVWLMLVIGAVLAYQKFEHKFSKNTPFKLAEPAAEIQQNFSCDGRQHCSQMTSCAEAKFFLKNCPNTKMDGDGDGIPCENQWCSGF